MSVVAPAEGIGYIGNILWDKTLDNSSKRGTIWNKKNYKPQNETPSVQHYSQGRKIFFRDWGQ